MCALCSIVRNLIKILDCFIVNSDEITVRTRSEGLRVVQLLELDVSALAGRGAVCAPALHKSWPVR